MQPYADKIESLVVNNVAGWVGLPAQIKHVNQSIEELAHFLYLDPFWGVKTSYPDANQVFNLSIGVSRSNLTLTYARQPLQPAPKSCTYYPDGGPSGTGVEAICSPNQAKGVTTLLLQGHTGGKWTDNPLDSTYEPGAHPGPQWAFLGSPPYADWSPNNGPDSGYAPVLVDYPVTSHTTVEMRVCSSNFWGLNCDAGVNVSGYTAGGSSGSSGGGGGGGGGGGVTGSGTGSPTGQVHVGPRTPTSFGLPLFATDVDSPPGAGPPDARQGVDRRVAGSCSKNRAPGPRGRGSGRLSRDSWAC